MSCLVVGGQNRQSNRLFSGGQDGEVWIYSVPGEGNDFQLLQVRIKEDSALKLAVFTFMELCDNFFPLISLY